MERIQRPKDLRTNPFTFMDIVPFTIWSPQHIHKDCSLEMCPQEGKCISVSPEQVRCSAWALGWLGAWHEPWAGWGLSVSPGPAGSCFAFTFLTILMAAELSFLYIICLCPPVLWRNTKRTMKKCRQVLWHLGQGSFGNTQNYELLSVLAPFPLASSELWKKKPSNGPQHADNNCFGKDQEAPAPVDAGFGANTCPRTTFHLSLFFKLKPPKAKTSCAKGKK